MIVQLDLAPGSIVSENTLAERLGVPRSEVRDAVQQLRESGLVSVLARAGISISPVAITEIRNVFDARLAIEGFAARLAAQRASPRDVEGLRALAARLIELAATISSSSGDDGALAELVELDRRLHVEVVVIARNPHLLGALSRVMLFNSRIWNLFYERNGAVGPFYVSHEELIEAIATGDADAAQVAVAHHLDSSAQTLRRVFEYGPE
jgi:DNA-binding GntR family transcriptional regulator